MCDSARRSRAVKRRANTCETLPNAKRTPAQDMQLELAHARWAYPYDHTTRVGHTRSERNCETCCSVVRGPGFTGKMWCLMQNHCILSYTIAYNFFDFSTKQLTLSYCWPREVWLARAWLPLNGSNTKAHFCCFALGRMASWCCH